MSELGFWVPARRARDSEGQASSPPVEDFAEATRQPWDDRRSSSNPPAGRAGESIFRIAESGFWVPVHESRSSNGTAASGQPPTRRSSAKQDSLEDKLLQLQRYFETPIDGLTGPQALMVKVRELQRHLSQPIDGVISAEDPDEQLAQLEKFYAAWDPAKHLRGGNPENTGQFSKVAGERSLRVAEWAKRAGLTDALAMADLATSPTESSGLLMNSSEFFNAVLTLLAQGSRYRNNFLEKVPELPEDWHVHHTKEQRLRKNWEKIGINIDDVEHLRGVPKGVHDEISAAQNKWWNEQMRKANVPLGDGKAQRKFFDGINLSDPVWQKRIKEYEEDLEKAFGKYWVGPDEKRSFGRRADYAKKIEEIEKAAKTKKFLTGRGARRLAVLEREFPTAAKALGLLGLFGSVDTIIKGLETADNIADPSPEAKAAWDNFEVAYRSALNEAEKRNQIRWSTAHQLRESFVNYLKATGVPENTVNIINTALSGAIDTNIVP